MTPSDQVIQVIEPGGEAFAGPGRLATLAELAAIHEEEIWLASQKSARTRRAYKQDVGHFMRTLRMTTPEQLRPIDHRAAIACERIMGEEERAAASTVRRRLSTLSSLFKHLVRHGTATRNPVVDVARPNISREEGSTPLSPRPRRGDYSTPLPPTRSPGYATGRSFPWACR